MASIQFDILQYMAGLTGFVFDKAMLTRVALDRGVAEVTSVDELTRKDKDLLTADLLLIAYLSPNVWASFDESHGSFKKGVGSQSVYNKEDIYDWLFGIYKKYDDEMLDQLDERAHVFFKDI